jgi:hypothetical protein
MLCQEASVFEISPNSLYQSAPWEASMYSDSQIPRSLYEPYHGKKNRLFSLSRATVIQSVLFSEIPSQISMQVGMPGL